MTTHHRNDSLRNKAAGILPAIERSAPVEALTQALGGEPPQADPDMQLVLNALIALGGKPIETLSPEEARRQPGPVDAVKKVLAEKGLRPQAPHLSRIKALRIPGGPLGHIPAQAFIPVGEGPFPVILYFHGGGFVLADTRTYEASIIALAQGVEAVVVSVDYHQAPEHQFPTQPNEAFAAYRWLRQHAEEISGDRHRIAVAGESAGGNLAAVVAMMARDKGLPIPIHQLLIYPLVNNNVFNASYIQNANAKPLSAAMMKWFFKHYSQPMDASSPYALPDKAASLRGLPPATIITAEIDPLHDEGKEFAERLESEGVPVAYRYFSGVVHEFFGMADVVAKAKLAQIFAIRELRKAFQAV